MGSRLILVFILLLVVAVTKGIRSTCNVKVETNGTSADIVCNFSIDVSAVINDFEVDLVQVNGSSRRQETVFMCYKTQGKTECIHRPGYQLQGIVSETVTLKIPELSQEHAGQYMCYVIPSDPSEVQMCDLPSEVIALGAPVRMDVDKRISDESTERIKIGEEII